MAKHKVEITGIKTSELKVLSNEEQIDLFNKMKNGDKFAREKLIEGNYKLVLSILRKFNWFPFIFCFIRLINIQPIICFSVRINFTSLGVFFPCT